MGLFEKLGREVEEFKQNAKRAADESSEYRCRSCGERFHLDHDECPECGSDDVESTAE
jgi:rRNA maturation endonuclease Nob1